MCGIIGYTGTRKASGVLLDSLRRLEYRGYDSVGMSTICNKQLLIKKGAGMVDEVDKNVQFQEMQGTIGIAHTRWSTHGAPTEVNSHPHTNIDRTLCVVHNGIIENYRELKSELVQEGYTFESTTDTEIIPHLIDWHMKQGKSFQDAFTAALDRLEGSYAILATHANNRTVMFARHGSPLVIGLGKEEYFVSSDIPSFLPYTKTIIHLEDGDYGSITDTIVIENKGKHVTRTPHTADWDVEVAKKGNYPHFMIKEITEQPLTIRKAINQTRELISHTTKLLQNASTVFLVGCGTSYNTCATAAYQFSQSGKHTIPVLASEFEQHVPFIDENTVVIAVSQSGETADVLDAVTLAKNKGATIVAVVNVPSSTLARTAGVVIPSNSGPEICVLSTKTFTAQLAILHMLAYALEGKNTQDIARAADASLNALKQYQQTMPELAKKLKDARTIFVIGRNGLSQIAREAALKIKEVSYIHAEGMPAGELKHGTMALIEEGVPVIVFADDETRELTLSNAMEVKARGAYVIGVDTKSSPVYDYHIPIPDVAPTLLSILPIQLLSYYLAIERGCDPDKPRNLAKSVTVR